MKDLSTYDHNAVSNPNNNIFGLPFSEEEASVVIIPVPWEVTVSYGAGTARIADPLFKASLQVDICDPEMPDAWRQGYFMREPDKAILLKSDYLRKEAELYIDYISEEEAVEENMFMSKTLVDVNEGGIMLNNWVYENTTELMKRNKLVGLLGGDHSVSLGYLRALAEKHDQFGILQIDAHLDLREAYEGFVYSHASIMSNALTISQVEKLVSVGIRDFGDDELAVLKENGDRIAVFYDRNIKERLYEGDNWCMIADEIIASLPQKVYLSFDIDGLDPKLCPNTGTPVPGGLELDQIYYLLKKLLASGRHLIGFDLVEVSAGDNSWDANVGARILFKLCNYLVTSNQNNL